jgi:hypothetical protein
MLGEVLLEVDGADDEHRRRAERPHDRGQAARLAEFHLVGDRPGRLSPAFA